MVFVVVVKRREEKRKEEKRREKKKREEKRREEKRREGKEEQEQQEQETQAISFRDYTAPKQKGEKHPSTGEEQERNKEANNIKDVQGL